MFGLRLVGRSWVALGATCGSRRYPFGLLGVSWGLGGPEVLGFPAVFRGIILGVFWDPLGFMGLLKGTWGSLGIPWTPLGHFGFAGVHGWSLVIPRTGTGTYLGIGSA